MRIIVLFILSIILCGFGQAATIPFAPIVKSYSVSDYDAGIQNWSIAQDKRGVMFFGNNNGLLEYDGTNWRLHELPTQGIVRSVYIGTDERIYVGSYEEFGYFVRTPYNTLEYHSLKAEVKDFDFQNDEIWNILTVHGKIVFQSFRSFFSYDGQSVESFRTDGLPLNLFQVGDTFYTQKINGGLCRFSDRKMDELIPREQLGNSDVLFGLPYGNATLLLTRNQGCFTYGDGVLKKWQTDCDDIFKKHTINRAVMTKDGCYVIGTISDGVYALDKNGNLLWKVNTDNNLHNNTVLGLYCDEDNNIWVALDEGIAYIHNNSLIYYYEPPFRKIGMVYDVLIRKDEAYIASNQGLYRLRAGGNLELVPGLEEQAWYVDEMGGKIFCGHNKGTFCVSGLQSKLLSDSKGGMCMEKIELKEQTYLLAGTYTLLDLYDEEASGTYRFSHSLDGFSQMILHIEVDHQNNVWAKHLRNGLYRFRISPDMKHVTGIKKYERLGDAERGNIALFKINGRVAFSDGERFYTYEDLTDSIVPYQTINKQLPGLKGIINVSHAGGDKYWFVADRMVSLVKCMPNMFRIEMQIPYSLFDVAMEDRSSVVYDPKSRRSYLCMNNAIARIETDSASLYKSTAKRSLSISKIEAIDELTGERNVLPIGEGAQVRPSFNTVSFDLSYPAYDDYTYKIRYRLDGYSDQWMSGERYLQKKYSQLPSGKYVFRAEVCDAADRVLSSVEFPFEIPRPWYLSYWALGVYVVLGIGVLALLQYFVYYSLKKKKVRAIEQQRIAHRAELECQQKKIIALEKEQLESDLRSKSKELSGVVMTNIAHQEFLNSLKEEIQQQKLSGQYSRKNLDKLLALVNANIVSDAEYWTMFQANFDRIHENFFRNLKMQYPDLTPGDLRFCSLLRLNMPTKDMAKLLNISTRGVDAARYRLRKKLNLSSEESLTDFMINFR